MVGIGVPAMGTVGATTIVGRTAVGVADALPGTRAAAIGGERSTAPPA